MTEPMTEERLSYLEEWPGGQHVAGRAILELCREVRRLKDLERHWCNRYTGLWHDLKGRRKTIARLEAEAASMRAVLEKYIVGHTGFSCHDGECVCGFEPSKNALSGDAGRKLSERFNELRDFATAVHARSDSGECER